MSRWLILGAGGMLGRELTEVLTSKTDISLTSLDRAALDITDADAVDAAVAGQHIVINTASWTDVDGAETHEAAATAVNGDAVRTVASACATHGARLLQISTDYVLPGTARTPYPEDAPTAPVNAYGRGKLLGEQAVRELLPDTGYVVRTAWLYGQYGRNFVTTVLDLADHRATLDVVDDQQGQPTWAYALSHRLLELGSAAERGQAPPGVYHATSSGHTTWYGLAREAFALAGLDPERIRPTTTDRYPRPARRPRYSVLGHERWQRAGLPALPHWREMLQAAFDHEGWLTRRKART